MGRTLVNTTQVGTVVYAAGTEETEELAAAIPNPALWTEGEALVPTPGTLVGDGGEDDPVEMLAAVIRREVDAALAPLYAALDVEQPEAEQLAAQGANASDGPKDWSDENLDDLKAEVAARNEDRGDADQIVIGGSKNKPDYVAALSADDAARA